MSATSAWFPASEKPQPYKTVLLEVFDGWTTGWWADKAGESGEWIGLALNQSPPVFRLAQGLVTRWASINVDAPLPTGCCMCGRTHMVNQIALCDPCHEKYLS